MHVNSPIFHGKHKEKKLTDNFNSLGAREGEKMPKKDSKKWKSIFFVLNKYQSVTHVYACIFQGL